MIMFAIRRFTPAIVAATAVAATLMLSGCSEVYNHEQFVTLVKDKSEAEVLDQIGKPGNIDKSDPSRVTLTYMGRTYDLDKNNKFDSKAVVVLAPITAGGPLKVKEVVFQ
jgi:hypothetical protein